MTTQTCGTASSYKKYKPGKMSTSWCFNCQSECFTSMLASPVYFMSVEFNVMFDLRFFCQSLEFIDVYHLSTYFEIITIICSHSSPDLASIYSSNMRGAAAEIRYAVRKIPILSVQGLWIRMLRRCVGNDSSRGHGLYGLQFSCCFVNAVQ